MERTTIKKSIKISAPKEKVWKVLLDDKYTRTWYAEFNEGSYVETDWKVGSKAYFKDTTGQGLAARIVENKPNEAILIEHQAVLLDGKEDTESDEAKKWVGCLESYRLSEQGGVTQITVEHDTPSDYLQAFVKMWENALLKIKELSEN